MANIKVDGQLVDVWVASTLDAYLVATGGLSSPTETYPFGLADPATRRHLIADEERMKPRDNVLQGGGAATTTGAGGATTTAGTPRDRARIAV